MYYAVKKGRTPGIYNTWAECQEQVKGYSNAQFKKFKTVEEAEAYIAEAEHTPLCVDYRQPDSHVTVAYVDGSYNVHTKEVGFGMVVFTAEGQEERCGIVPGDVASQRNVAGEVYAARQAMEYAIGKGKKILHLYYDYTGIRHWAKKEWKANMPLTREYQNYASEAAKKLEIHFHKVEAHTGDTRNEYVDK